MTDVIVNISDQTTPVTQAGFGLILIFDPATDASYEEVTQTSDISGWVSGDLAYDMAARALEQEPSVEKVALYGVDVTTVGTSIATELDSLVVDRPDFYWLVTASRTDQDQIDGADWAASNDRIAVIQPDISFDIDTNLSTFMANFNTDRNSVYFHDGGELSEEQYLDAGVAGKLAALEVGSWTAKFKTIAGVANTQYLAGDISAIHAENANTYTKKMGILQTTEGLTSAGGYLDTQVNQDWLKARIEENISKVLYSANKIPYDDSGIAVIVGALRDVLNQAFRKGIIAADTEGNALFSIDYPRRVDITENNRANRMLPDIKFETTIAGAIHNVTINGVLQV